MAREWLYRYNQIENARRNLRRARVFRDAENPFEHFDEEEFRQRFRFRKDTAMDIIDLISEEIARPTSRSRSVPPMFQVLTALRFYATGTFQLAVGDIMRFSQPTVCRIIQSVSIALAHKKGQYLFLPRNRNTIKAITNEFYNIDSFPNVVGAIDCTHIRISNPGGEEAQRFINRKGFFSLNVQAVCDAQGKFTNLVARWPGSAHDSRIFAESQLSLEFERGEISGLLLGDPGYPCLPHLMTPIGRPNTPAEIRYNRSQRKTRGIIERVFGIWKRRFPCLHIGLRTKLQTTFAIIIAVGVLHNIAVNHNEPDFENEFWDEALQNLVDVGRQRNQRGERIRQQIVNHFANLI